jgi:hypothetical protein
MLPAACAPQPPEDLAVAEPAAPEARIVMPPALPGLLSDAVTVRPLLLAETRPADSPRAPSVVVLPLPAPAAEPAAATAAAAPRPPRLAAPGGPQVQLVAAGSEAEATAHWNGFAQRAPDLAEGRSPLVLAFERPGLPTVWRLRVGGFESAGAAGAWCGRLRARGIACWVSG